MGSIFTHFFLISGNILQGLLILGIAYSGCNSTGAILFLISATGVAGATASGMLSNVVDLSPNFASKSAAVHSCLISIHFRSITKQMQYSCYKIPSTDLLVLIWSLVL